MSWGGVAISLTLSALPAQSLGAQQIVQNVCLSRSGFRLFVGRGHLLILETWRQKEITILYKKKCHTHAQWALPIPSGRFNAKPLWTIELFGSGYFYTFEELTQVKLKANNKITGVNSFPLMFHIKLSKSQIIKNSKFSFA